MSILLFFIFLIIKPIQRDAMIVYYKTHTCRSILHYSITILDDFSFLFLFLIPYNYVFTSLKLTEIHFERKFLDYIFPNVIVGIAKCMFQFNSINKHDCYLRKNCCILKTTLNSLAFFNVSFYRRVNSIQHSLSVVCLCFWFVLSQNPMQ